MHLKSMRVHESPVRKLSSNWDRVNTESKEALRIPKCYWQGKSMKLLRDRHYYLS